MHVDPDEVAELRALARQIRLASQERAACLIRIRKWLPIEKSSPDEVNIWVERLVDKDEGEDFARGLIESQPKPAQEPSSQSRIQAVQKFVESRSFDGCSVPDIVGEIGCSREAAQGALASLQVRGVVSCDGSQWSATFSAPRPPTTILEGTLLNVLEGLPETFTVASLASELDTIPSALSSRLSSLRQRGLIEWVKTGVWRKVQP